MTDQLSLWSDITTTRQARRKKLAVAKPDDIQKLWTEIALNPGEKTSDRLKAAEALARSLRMFVEQKDVTVNGAAAVLVVPPKDSPVPGAG